MEGGIFDGPEVGAEPRFPGDTALAEFSTYTNDPGVAEFARMAELLINSEFRIEDIVTWATMEAFIKGGKSKLSYEGHRGAYVHGQPEPPILHVVSVEGSGLRLMILSRDGKTQWAIHNDGDVAFLRTDPEHERIA